MIRIWRNAFIIMLITVFVTTNISVALAANPKFNDVVGNPFRQQIEEVTAAGLLSGYPNGQFKPNTSLSGNDGVVTMLQLYITVIRGLGLENQAKNYNLNSINYAFSPTIGKEFRGYLAIAADKNLLDSRYVEGLKSNTAANRMSVATILATAFNIKSNNTDLPFADQNQITNSYYRTLIAGIYQNGIMSGDSQGNFRFNSAITREEYAVVLSRLLNKGFIKPQNKLISNTRLLSFSNNKIKVSQNYGLSMELELAKDCPAYINNAQVGYNQLANQQVDLYLDANNKVSYIKSYTASNSNGNVVVVSKESGRVDKVVINNGGTEIIIEKSNGYKATYKLDANVKIYKDGKSAYINDLKTNSFVELELDQSIVRKINIKEAEEYEGFITRIRNSSIRVEEDDNDDMDFSVDQDVVKVIMDDDDYDYDDLKTGYEVRITYEDDEAIEIEVLDDTPDGLEGIVTSIDHRDYEISIDYGDDEKDFDVDDDVDVSGEVSDWDDIDEDHWVKLTIEDGDVVEIEVMDIEDGQFSGVVTDVDTRRAEVTIKRESGYEHTFDVDDDEVDLDDIIIGSEVELTVNDSYVDDIEVIDDEDIVVIGEITDLDSDGEGIEITQDSGNEFSFDVDRDVEVFDEDGDEIDFDDLEEDWEVELTLDNGDVVEIRIID